MMYDMGYGQYDMGCGQYGMNCGQYDMGMMYRPPHYSRAQYLEGLRQYIWSMSNVQVTGEDKIEELPQLFRHACARNGVSQLCQSCFQVPETGVTIPFYFCTSCGRLYYYKDFI